MKKKFFTYLGIAITSLFVGFTQVKADVNVITYNNWYYYYSDALNAYTTAQSDLQQLYSYYEVNLASDYPYYVVYYSKGYSPNHDRLYLIPTHTNTATPFTGGDIDALQYSTSVFSGTNPVMIYADIVDHTYTYQVPGYSGPTAGMPRTSYIPIAYSSDFVIDTSGTSYDKVILPSYTNNDLDVSYSSYELFDGDTIPSIDSLYNGSYDTYQEINLNNYAYVILSLKDYNQDTFWTNIYTLGRLCLTPVYNYGMTQRQDVLTGTQIQGCTISYDTFTPVNVSIIQSDIDNHAVYYVQAYQNETTKIKVNTNVFDISYISSANANNPSVTIDGRSYPTIPYTDLTDSASISTDTGYISGQVCNPGDVNCASTITGIDVSDLWTQPLQLFKTVGSSITAVLGVITVFITFLPPTLQAFLYTAFFLVIILGILKILL